VALTYERRVPPGGGIVIAAILSIILWLAFIGVARAQEPAKQQPTFLVYVDTAGVAPVGAPGIYITWVFAKASPNAYPSSGVLVAWDCLNKPRLVKRLASVVYHMTADSAGVTGNIQEVERPWQAVTDEHMADLVCEIGPTHKPSVVVPSKPKSPYSDA
jgi:hypothetical protein